MCEYLINLNFAADLASFSHSTGEAIIRRRIFTVGWGHDSTIWYDTKRCFLRTLSLHQSRFVILHILGSVKTQKIEERHRLSPGSVRSSVKPFKRFIINQSHPFFFLFSTQHDDDWEGIFFSFYFFLCVFRFCS